MNMMRIFPNIVTNGSTVLVVDDNNVNVALLSDLLQSAGCKVLSAPDGTKALTRAKFAELILLDVMMPGIDGFEVCKRLKAAPETSDIPVVFMTALDSEADKIRGFDVGGVDYITKPFHHAEVLARVTVHIKISRLTKHLDRMVQERTEQLQDALEELSKRDKQKGDSLIEAANELQYPLAVLQEQWSALHNGQSVSSESVARLGESIDILTEIIRSMVELARLDANKRPVARQIMNLQQIFDKLYFQYSPVFNRRDLLFDTELAQLPIIEADPLQLSIAFENILVNAIAYTPDGGKIAVKGKLDGKKVIVTIRDTGIGIAKKDHQRIFDRYYRAGLRSTSRARIKTDFLGGGAGLGLVIAKEIICDHHGGHIWVESPGRDIQSHPGSVFYVSLPIHN